MFSPTASTTTTMHQLLERGHWSMLNESQSSANTDSPPMPVSFAWYNGSSLSALFSLNLSYTDISSYAFNAPTELSRVIERQLTQHWIDDQWLQVLLLSVYWTMTLLAICSNTSILLVVACRRRLWTPSVLLSSNLLLASLASALLCMPLTLQSLVSRRWTLGWLCCKLLPFLQSVCVFVSSFTVVSISADRYLRITWLRRTASVGRSSHSAAADTASIGAAATTTSTKISQSARASHFSTVSPGRSKCAASNVAQTKTSDAAPSSAANVHNRAISPARSVRAQLLNTALIWLLSALFSAPVLIYQELTTVGVLHVFTYNACLERWPDHVRVLYTIATFVCAFAVPIGALCFFHLAIRRYLNQNLLSARLLPASSRVKNAKRVEPKPCSKTQANASNLTAPLLSNDRHVGVGHDAMTVKHDPTSKSHLAYNAKEPCRPASAQLAERSTTALTQNTSHSSNQSMINAMTTVQSSVTVGADDVGGSCVLGDEDDEDDDLDDTVKHLTNEVVDHCVTVEGLIPKVRLSLSSPKDSPHRKNDLPLHGDNSASTSIVIGNDSSQSTSNAPDTSFTCIEMTQLEIQQSSASLSTSLFETSATENRCFCQDGLNSPSIGVSRHVRTRTPTLAFSESTNRVQIGMFSSEGQSSIRRWSVSPLLQVRSSLCGQDASTSSSSSTPAVSFACKCSQSTLMNRPSPVHLVQSGSIVNQSDRLLPSDTFNENSISNDQSRKFCSCNFQSRFVVDQNNNSHHSINRDSTPDDLAETVSLHAYHLNHPLRRCLSDSIIWFGWSGLSSIDRELIAQPTHQQTTAKVAYNEPIKIHNRSITSLRNHTLCTSGSRRINYLHPQHFDRLSSSTNAARLEHLHPKHYDTHHRCLIHADQHQLHRSPAVMRLSSTSSQQLVDNRTSFRITGFVARLRRVQRLHRELRRTSKVTFVLILAIVVFAISWLPLSLYNLYLDLQHVHVQLSVQMFYVILFACHLLAMSSTVSNAVLYGFLNTNIQRELRQVLSAAKRLLCMRFSFESNPFKHHVSLSSLAAPFRR